MRISDYFNQILDSDPSDWHAISCGGAYSGPSYRYALENLTTYSAGIATTSIVANSHNMVAAFTQNISITIAWGLTSNEEFQEDWANGFPDPHASSSHVDFFFHGALVCRQLYVTVDGGRVSLPVPERGENKELTVPAGYLKLVRLLNALEGPYADEYDEYLRRAQITVVNEPWPRFST